MRQIEVAPAEGNGRGDPFRTSRAARIGTRSVRPWEISMMASGQPRPLSARRRRGGRAIGAAALTVLIAACAAPTPSGSPASSVAGSAPASAGSVAPGSSLGATGVPDLAAVLDPTLTPIDLTVTPEAGNTVSATIPATGGEMTATGADGTVYTLTIPDDALLVDTEISMTPVATVQGLPTSGEQTHAVQLGPDGLQLEDFATLTIAPASALPPDQRIPFGYEETGTGMFLAFPKPRSMTIQLELLHFSGYGVTKGELANLDDVLKRFGGDADARFESLITARMAAESALERAGQPVPLDYWAGIEALVDDYERDVVQRRVDAAGLSCANARVAWNSVLTLERWRQLLAIESDAATSEAQAEAQATARAAAKAALLKTRDHICTQEEYELCHDQHIVHRMRTLILGYNRQRQVLGIDDAEEWQFEKDTAKKCLTFEVRFVSVGDETRFPLEVVSKVKATVKISLDTESLKITGESALINTSIDIRQTLNTDCTVQAIRGGSVFEVTDLTFNSTPDTEPRPATLTSPGRAGVPGKLSDVALTYQFTESTDSGTMKCPQTPLQTLAGPWWSAIYFGTHGRDRAGSNGPYSAKAWKTRDRVEKVGTKEWHEPRTAGLTEEGSFELYHRPS